MAEARLSGRVLADERMLALLSDEAFLAALGRYEVALAEAQAAEGVIAPAAAAAIRAAVEGFRPDAAAIAAAARSAGPLAIPYLAALRRSVAGEAGQAALHLGSTSQDLLDTALVLQLREAQTLLAEDLGKLRHALIRQAEAHLDTLAIGRTLLQPAQPVTLGLKFAQWAASLAACERALARDAAEALVLQFGGASGTLSVLGEKAAAVAERLGALLALPVPAAPWQNRREGMARFGASLAILAGALGKIARDIALSMQAEVGEFGEAAAGGSSAMPHKRNPVAAVVALQAAGRAPGLAATLIGGLAANEHERGLGGWQGERAVLEDLMLLTHGAVAAMLPALAEMSVDPARAAENLAATHGTGASEQALAALSPALGRAEAGRIVEGAVAAATRSGATASGGATAGDFAAALAQDPQVAIHLDGERLAALGDPARQTGSARRFALALIETARGDS